MLVVDCSEDEEACMFTLTEEGSLCRASFVYIVFALRMESNAIPPPCFGAAKFCPPGRN